MSANDCLELARRAASVQYGLRGSIERLPGYDDHNYRVRTGSSVHLLKITGPDVDPGPVHFQTALLEFLALSRLPLETPRVVPTQRGEPWEYIEDVDGRKRIVRLLTWIPGTFLAAIPAPSDVLLRSVGCALAHLDLALMSFSFAGMDRRLDWDLRQALLLTEDLDAIPDPSRRTLAETGFTRFADIVLPVLQNLPESVIHNDANEHNILVSTQRGRDAMSGLIDFGDAVRTATVIEPAVAATYAMMLRDDGEAAAVALLSGYQQELPLGDLAVSLLADLIRTRLCVSVVQSARKTSRTGPDAYVTVSEDGAWRLLESMGEERWMRFSDTLEQALNRP